MHLISPLPPPVPVGVPVVTGSSYQQAIVLEGATNENTGVQAEYEWVRTHFPGCRVVSQSLHHHNDRHYDVLKISGGLFRRTTTVYFDITHFFGKF